jgi:tripartite-type tricarboxylate transporter receptor subunit TctC
MRVIARHLLILVSIMLTAGSGMAVAQAYPSKPIRIIEAGGVGGPPDIIARGIAEGMSRTLGQPVVVENRIGANGIVGTDACAKANPDGYTFCVLSNVYLSMNPYLYAKLPYDPVRDIAPIINMGFIGGVIIAHPSLPVNSVRELVEFAKSKPGALNWASWGTGSFAHLTLALLETSTGTSFNHVPYKAPGLAVQGVVAGEANLTQNNPRVMVPLIKAGKLKPIGVVGPKRFSILPEVPTFAEQGYDLDFLRGSFGVYAPAALPRPIVMQWNQEVNKLMADAGFLEKFVTGLGLDPQGGTPEEFAAFLKADRGTAARVAKAANLQAQ